MPLFKHWQSGAFTQAAIWHITEPEAFFTAHTGLQSTKTSPIKRLEHLAGRFLLQLLMPGFPLDRIRISATGKPYLEQEQVYFSISHSYPFAAASVNRKEATGLDVQTLQPKIIRLQHKFLSDEEQALCKNDIELITLAWAAKEAVFKQYGLGAVDFKAHMPLRSMEVKEGNAAMNMDFSKGEAIQPIQLQGGIEPGFVWSVTA